MLGGLNHLLDKTNARLTGRAWWAVRYLDGRLVHELHANWTELDRRGLAAIMLYCPSGEVPVLGSTADASGRLFQFNAAILSYGAGVGPAGQLAGASGARGTTYHVIGRVEHHDGSCTWLAWDYVRSRLIGPESGNVHTLHRLFGLGPLNLDVIGVRL